ncbi:MAG TPA: 4Fe-4S dicluster domain-containing protein [Vicinamibacterales bacterium]|nr:4Fe-4S dicluster domain-containing protein [Vicinamibacterales bacterium]
MNRCWVKTVEEGAFPQTHRFFFPVLCNQCDSAPCARICPTRALYRRRDGIVDLDPMACIGCRACMVACPYDQLFIDPNTQTAEKCNFCANRVEQQLLPACVSVCPTECRIFGDLDDPASEVARIAQMQDAAVRKPEKGTVPKVFYLAAHDAAIRPEAAARPFLYKEGQVLLRPLGAPEPDPNHPDRARVDYDTPHAKPWGLDMAIYLLTKGIATGTMLLSAMLWALGDRSAITRIIGPAISLAFLLLTTVILIADLERPQRFYYIVTRPNWRSWLVWGTYFLIAHGAVATLWIVSAWLGYDTFVGLLVAPAIIASILATAYTAFLFAQGLARDLWQGPQSMVDLLAQAVAEGAAALTLPASLSWTPDLLRTLAVVLTGALLVHLALVLFEVLVMRSPTRHHELAVGTMRSGPLTRTFWGGAVACVVLPLIVLFNALASGVFEPVFIAGLFAFAGAFAWDYVWVEAGQSVPLS